MGEIWQVIAREMRGWSAKQCGNFLALAGISQMIGTLLTAPSIRRLGARGHTLASTASHATAAVILGHARSDVMAHGALVPLGLGAGRVQATSACIVKLADDLGVPQGQLSAKRNALNAIIKIVSPSIYAWL